MTVHGAMPKEASFRLTLRVDIHAFSLHASVRCGADDRQTLDQRCC
jgi:hypothetical protein